jgi:hypothetical protein
VTTGLATADENLKIMVIDENSYYKPETVPAAKMRSGHKAIPGQKGEKWGESEVELQQTSISSHF